MSFIETAPQKRRKVLITGGSGTVGLAFIDKYYDEFEFYSISNNQRSIKKLNEKFPDVQSFEADIQKIDQLNVVFREVKPDIVVHAADFNPIDDASVSPSRTVQINILGSLNVAKASVAANVPIVVGISSDKACQLENIYGYSKKILEQMFLEHFTERSKFVCARLTNISCSKTSVIPSWVISAQDRCVLNLTDSPMNQLISTAAQAAKLIRDSISYAENSTKPFVLCERAKSVGMMELAQLISDDFGDGSKPQVIGLRPYETLNEVLLSESDIENAFYSEDAKHIFIHSDEHGEKRVTKPLTSLTAQVMSQEDMRSLYSQYSTQTNPSISLALSK